MPSHSNKKTLQSKWNIIQEWLQERRSQLSAAILLVVAAGIIVAWQIQWVQNLLVESGALQFLILAAILDVSVTVSK